MEDNYLWDRSGEPDPEVQELEEILGTLRYQPRPLEIPVNVRVDHRRSFFPAMAVAAAMALLAILLGLWFSFNRHQPTPTLEAKQNPQIDPNRNAPTPQVSPDRQAPAPVAVNSPNPKGTQKRESPRNLLALKKGRGAQTQIRQPGLTPEELAEKEQVLIALRLVSAKLNLAQRKAQGAPQLNVIRNQHKIG
jgi:hypothetical protein